MTAESVPRIVRLLPARFSRDPKAVKTGENTAAALLLAFTLAAILWANSPWADSYSALMDTRVGFSFDDMTFELTVNAKTAKALSLTIPSSILTSANAIIGKALHVRFGSKANMCGATMDVRFTPENGHCFPKFSTNLTGQPGT